MNTLDKQYQQLLKSILDFGVEKSDRTGTGTKSIFGHTIRHKMSHGFPILTTKKVHFKSVATELIWFLRGDTNIKYLVDNDCNIWNGDAYKKYLKKYENLIGGEFESLGIQESNNLDWAKLNPTLTQEEFINQIKTDDEFAKKWGELGPIYGKQWRDWATRTLIDPNTFEYPHVDQIANLISELKTNPDSRRLMVNAWNVGELDQMTLPPCHYGFQVYTRKLTWIERFELFEKRTNGSRPYDNKMLDDHNIPTRAISLMWNQRSVDTFLGLPFNIASYGLLLEIIAKEVNMVPDELIGSLGDTHLYLDHLEQAKIQITRDSFALPTLQLNPIFLYNLEHKSFDEAINGQINFQLNDYKSHSAIKAPLSN
jgi:thymidylate synthase